MKKGRQREHFQWNMDIVGITAPSAEAELMACLVETFDRLGLTSEDIGIKVSSRQVRKLRSASEGWWYWGRLYYMRGLDLYWQNTSTTMEVSVATELLFTTRS